jgi:hypothetical protein
MAYGLWLMAYGKCSILFLFGRGQCYEGYNPWSFTPQHSPLLTPNSFQGILSNAWKFMTVEINLGHNTGNSST